MDGRYPFTGFWREAVNEVDVEDIHESETERIFAGEVQFWYDIATSAQNKNMRDLVEGLTTVKHLNIIQTSADIPFKPGDEITLYDGNVFGVAEMSEYLPDKYKRIAGMNPNLRHRYKIKVLVLR